MWLHVTFFITNIRVDTRVLNMPIEVSPIRIDISERAVTVDDSHVKLDQTVTGISLIQFQ